MLTLRRGWWRRSFRVEELGADDAGPVLRRYFTQVRVTRPYFDARRSDPVSAFAAEAARHPVFELTEVPASP